MFARRRTEAGRTWGFEAGDREWMTVEQMWDRHPERFAAPGFAAEEPDPRAVPELTAS